MLYLYRSSPFILSKFIFLIRPISFQMSKSFADDCLVLVQLKNQHKIREKKNGVVITLGFSDVCCRMFRNRKKYNHVKHESKLEFETLHATSNETNKHKLNEKPSKKKKQQQKQNNIVIITKNQNHYNKSTYQNKKTNIKVPWNTNQHMEWAITRMAQFHPLMKLDNHGHLESSYRHWISLQ